MISFRLDVFHHFPTPPEIPASILERLDRIMATQQELADQLTAVTAAVAKIGTETQTLLARIADLEAAVVAAGNTTPEVDAALDALRAQVAVVDELVPDAQS